MKRKGLVIRSVLFITRKFPPSVGGMQKLSYDLSRAMAKDCKVTTIAWGRGQQWLPLFLIIAAVRSVRALRTSEPPEVVLLGDVVLAPLGWLLKFLCRVRIAVIVNGLDLVFPGVVHRLILLPCLRQLDRFICISENTRRLAIERGVAAEKTCVELPGIDSGAYAVSSRKDGRGALGEHLRVDLNGRFILLSVGRLVPRKGVTWFLEEVLPALVARHPEVLLLVAGAGPDQTESQQLVSRYRLEQNVRLLGRVDDQLLKRLYGCADVFIMPNIRLPNDPEGFGLVVLEAALYGLCVVASDTDGIPDALAGGQLGRMVECGNAAGYLEALSDLINDPDKRRAMESRSRAACVELFDWSRRAPAYVRALESA